MMNRVFGSLAAAATCMMLFFCSNAFAQQGKTVTISATEVPAKKVMAEIENQTKYLFVYTDEIDVERTVTISAKAQSLTSVLDKLFAGTDVSYTLSGTNIVLSRRAEQKATPATITGSVKDATGQPIVGAGIFLKGTTTGTITDLDGNFTLSISDLPEKAVLNFSCLGYQEKDLAIGSKRAFDVVLADDSILMEGTVVTALGIKRSEKALSYNVQQVSSDELLANKDANFVNSLNGKVAGLVINSSSAGVGGASKVVMRGSKSIAKSSNALYVIDGVPMYTVAGEASTGFGSRGTTDPIADINPEDIESMSVLTGAAAAALYGSEAANGAIIAPPRKALPARLRSPSLPTPRSTIRSYSLVSKTGTGRAI